MNHVISDSTQVTLHFAIRLADGTLVDSNFDKEPATFAVGDGNLLPGFEKALFGMVAGEKREVTITPAQGFGVPNPSNVQRMRREDFAADLDLQPGLMLSFADANQSELPGVIKKVEGDDVEVDFNHPLAGYDLLFDVHILEVKPQ